WEASREPGSTRLRRGGDVDLSGDGAYFDAIAPRTDARSQRVLALFFDHDGDVRADLPGDVFGREVEAGAARYGQLDTAGSGLELPVAVRAGIAFHRNATGNGVRLHVVVGADDFDGAAGAGGVDAAAGTGHAYGSGNGVGVYVAF